MKSHFPAYCKLNHDDVDEIFDDCIFVFDTNALLDLYRVPKDTAEKILEVFKANIERIRVPYHVSEEYCSDLKGVITTQIGKVEDARSKFDNFYKFIAEKRNQPHISSNALNKLNLFKKVFEKELKEHEDYLWDELRYGYMNNSLIEILEGALFEQFTEEKINEIEKEGIDRYNNKVPPGYKDCDKQNNKYGDLIIWHEILHFVSNEHRNIVFVTNDWKEDLMESFKGIDYAPRQEMLVEFKQASRQNNFIIMKLDQFLERVNKQEDEGGPGLSEEDIERIKSLFFETKDFTGYESLAGGNDIFPLMGTDPLQPITFSGRYPKFKWGESEPSLFSQSLKGWPKATDSSKQDDQKKDGSEDEDEQKNNTPEDPEKNV